MLVWQWLEEPFVWELMAFRLAIPLGRLTDLRRPQQRGAPPTITSSLFLAFLSVLYPLFVSVLSIPYSILSLSKTSSLLCVRLMCCPLCYDSE